MTHQSDQLHDLLGYMEAGLVCHRIRDDLNTLSHGKSAVGKKQHFPPTKSPTFPTLWDCHDSALVISYHDIVSKFR